MLIRSTKHDHRTLENGPRFCRVLRYNGTAYVASLIRAKVFREKCSGRAGPRDLAAGRIRRTQMAE